MGSSGSIINLNEVSSSWGFWNLRNEFWGSGMGLNSSIFVMVLVLVVLLVMALMLGSTALFKVSFLSLVDFLLFTHEGFNRGVDHVLDLAL
jgi:diacylglycerol kinase